MSEYKVNDAIFEQVNERVPDDIDLALKEARVYYNDDTPDPVPILKIDGNAALTTGNISLIKGKAKAKKSFAMALITAIVAGDKVLHARIFGILPQGKKDCLYIDTEQGRSRVKRALRRISKLSGHTTDMPNIHVLSLRPYNHKERTAILERALETNSNYGLVVIDGIRDLIADINSAEESVYIVGKLMKLSEIYDCHIINVLHENKGDNNTARGHLGTELVNKAETILSVTKDPKQPIYSTIHAEMTRDNEFDDIIFSINDDGLPVICDHEIVQEEVKKNSPDSYDNHFHERLLIAVFDHKCIESYTGAWRAIKEWLTNEGIKCGDNLAKEFQKYYTETTRMLIKQDAPLKGYKRLTQKADLSEFVRRDDEDAPF